MHPDYCDCTRVQIASHSLDSCTGKIIGEEMRELYNYCQDDYGVERECRDCERVVLVALDSTGGVEVFSFDDISEVKPDYTLEEMLTHRNQEVRENAEVCYEHAHSQEKQNVPAV